MSVSIGLPCARILLVPVFSILDAYLRNVESALDEYTRQSNWPDGLQKAQKKELGLDVGFSIAMCKTHAESLYLTDLAIEYVLDHPLCDALAGIITDDDKRNDLAEMMRVWE